MRYPTYFRCLLIILLAFVIAGCGRDNTVHVVTVIPKEEPLMLTRTAQLRPLHTATIIPQASGRIKGTIPAVGTLVRKGDILLTLDTEPYLEQLARAEAENAAGASTPKAVVPAEKKSQADALLAAGAITRREYDALLARAAVAAPAAVSTPAQDTAAIRQAIAAGTLAAPINGRVSAVHVAPGDVLVAGRPALVLQSLSPLVGDFPLPNELHDPVVAARNTHTAVLTLAAPAGVRYGEITALSAAGSAIALRFRFDNPTGDLAPDRDYTLTLTLDRSYPLIHLPPTARVNEDAVYVVDENGLIHLRPVVTAYATKKDWVVLAGLSADEKVIVEPSPELEIGMQVRYEE